MVPEPIPSTAMSQPTKYHKFLTKLLQTTTESQGDKNRVYPLLEANQDKLDEVLRQIFFASLGN